MNNENDVTAEVAQLEHYLFDVWRWDDVQRIADQLDHDIACPLEGWDNNAEVRKLRQQLDAILSPAYALAINKVNETLSRLDPGPVRTVAVGRVAERLKGLQQPGGCYEYWDRLYYFKERELRPDLQQDQREVWAAVEQDIGYYIGRLVEHIERRIAEVEQGAPPPLNRLEWTCSTEVYVYLVRELMQRGYITLPGMNGKLGEGNVTEVFRRLSQAFILSKRDGGELTAEALQRRYNDDKLPLSKRAQLTLPEAKDVK